MLARRLLAFSGILVSTVLLAGQPVSAQYREGDRQVLVSPDGRIIRTVPEYGSVRAVIDQYGRRLLVNAWDEVVAIEMTVREFRRDQGRGFDRDRGLGPIPGQDRRGRDYFPAPPAPPGAGNDITSVVPVIPDPRDGYSNDFPNDYRDGQLSQDGWYGETYPTSPRAGIERRDLNPPTGTVPDMLGNAQPGMKTAIDRNGDKLGKAEITALQVFLDRNGMSPGVIDGRMGSNVEKALAAWEKASGEELDPSDTKTIMERLAAGDGLAFTEYTITAADAAGPYVASIPSDYSEKAKLERLAFTSTAEMLAEKFHMDETYLRELNPNADFSRPGTIVKVVQPGKKRTGEIASIVADKAKKQVRGYDSSGDLVVAYPATIGSSDTPSPSGQVSIERIAHNPNYTYNPKINFKQGNNDKVLEVPPGPNGPVGSVWIALSKPTYGIHGTPEPSKIGKTASHGCVRLTNWDAEELASMVKPGVTVMFSE